jgi:hypothetical protein
LLVGNDEVSPVNVLAGFKPFLASQLLVTGKTVVFDRSNLILLNEDRPGLGAASRTATTGETGAGIDYRQRHG